MNARHQTSTQLHIGLPARKELIDQDCAIEDEAFPSRQGLEIAAHAALQILDNHRYERNVSDAVAHKGVANVFRTQRAQVHDTCSAHKRPDEADHEINRVVSRQNAQVAHARPEGIPRSQRLALLKIISLREDTALRAASGPRGIYDAGWIFALAGDENRIPFTPKLLPSKGCFQVGCWRRFRHQHNTELVVLEVRVLGNSTPQVIFDDQEFGFGMREQLKLFAGAQLIVKWDENASGVKYRVSGDQPLRLIRHDNCGPFAFVELGVLKGSRQRQRHLLEIRVSQPRTLAIAV